MAYYRKGFLYRTDDYVKCIDNFTKAALLQRGPSLPEIYRQLGLSYAHAGFKEKAIGFVIEAFRLDEDSASYYNLLALIEDNYGNLKEAIEFHKKSYASDSTDRSVIGALAREHSHLDQFKESLKYFKKHEEIIKGLNRPLSPRAAFLIGYVYRVNGYNEDAEYYFDKGLEFLNELIDLDRDFHKDLNTYFALAGINAYRGDKEKAYEYLRIFNQRPRMPLFWIKNYKYNPLFDSIRGEPEFQQSLKDVEAKYQIQHEEVRQWLLENDML